MRKTLINAHRTPCRHRQRGIALPMVAAGLLAMLAIVGLALDTSHVLTNKTRLQSTTDATALAAAKKYDEAADLIAANAVALRVFGLNADGAGNHELNDAYDADEISIVIQWSETLNPFVSTGIGPYVRVIAAGFELNNSLSSVLGISNIDMSASAVAGPSPTINMACNIIPIVVCAPDPDDPDLFGFSAGKLEVLKSAPGKKGERSKIGPGNFRLVRLGCPGGNCVRENLAGNYEGCISVDETVETEPGNTIGPTVQGLNTRFGVYEGAMSSEQYPPDVVTVEPNPNLKYDSDRDVVTQNGTTVDDTTLDYGWDQYLFDVTNNILTNPPPTGVYERRVLALPIARCDGASAGQTILDVVGFGCYFLLQPAVQKGNEAQIFGQFIEGCAAGGVPGPNPVSDPGPYLIQLYKDPDSGDS